jgi:hypothetical protein
MSKTKRKRYSADCYKLFTLPFLGKEPQFLTIFSEHGIHSCKSAQTYHSSVAKPPENFRLLQIQDLHSMQNG